MIDDLRDENREVDPRLDTLLSRVLGGGSLPRQQRQRHLERLGLATYLGGSAGLWRAPEVTGRLVVSTPPPASLPSRRRHRQWLEPGAAVLAVVLVASLLVALSRDWSGGEGDNQLADSPEATATPRETREQLYVVSHAIVQAQDALITEGRVSAIDPQTGEEFWSVVAGPRIDSVLSPDGQRLFIADIQRDGDYVYALDTQTGRELWRQPIEDRQWHKPGSGSSMLSVSPDGTTLSVYSCEGCTGEIRSTDGRNWLAQFGATSGNRLADMEIPTCRGTVWLGPERPGIQPMYFRCDRSARLQILNLVDGQPLELTYDQDSERPFSETFGIYAAVVSADGRMLYVASGNRLTIIDMANVSARHILLSDDINIEQRLPLLALSLDGTRLFIGSLDTAAFDAGWAEVNRVDVYDTSSWQSLGQITPSEPLTSQAFAAATDDTSIYGVTADHPEGDTVVESTILHLNPDTGTTSVATRTNEEVLYLFAGTVEVDPNAEPLPTPMPEPSERYRLFAVSNTLAVGREIVGGRVTAYDAETGETAYAIETGANPQAVLSPTGTKLFIVASDEDVDTLTSYDALSGDENWSVAIQNAVQWIRGEGPSTLAVSQDGSRLFVYSATAPGDYTIQVFDTSDGRLGRVVDGVAGCTAQLFPSADGRSLYVVCLTESAAPQVIDLESWTSAGVVQGFGGIISGAAATTDGRYLYITHDIDTELRLTIVDTNSRSISEQRDIVHLGPNPLHTYNLTALSPDGSRLFIGIGQDPGETSSGDPTAREVWVWDTSSMAAGSIHTLFSALSAIEPIRGWSLAPGADNQSVYVNLSNTIARLYYDGVIVNSEEIASRPDWEVLRLFTSRVTDTPRSPNTDMSDPVPTPTWDGSLYVLDYGAQRTALLELDASTGETLRSVQLVPAGNNPFLVVAPNGRRLAVTAFLPNESHRLEVLIYGLDGLMLEQRIAVPNLIQSIGDPSAGIALSPDARLLHVYQYEAPPDGNGSNARYWLGTYDLKAQSWLADVELPGCGMVARMEVRSSPFVSVQCSRTGLLNVDTASGTVERIDGGKQPASFQHHGNKSLLLSTGGAFFSGAYWPSVDGQTAHQIDLPDGWQVMSLPFHVSGGFHRLYLPIEAIDDNAMTEIAVVDLSTHTITRTIQTSAPFREIVFVGDEQFAYLTLTDANGVPDRITRVNLATGGETLLVEGFYGNLVAVADDSP